MDLTPMHKRVIALDVHQAKITACAVVEHEDGRVEVTKRDFGTVKRDRRALAAWSLEIRPEVVVMESTGVYWKSPFAALGAVGIIGIDHTELSASVVVCHQRVVASLVCGAMMRTATIASTRSRSWHGLEANSDAKPRRCIMRRRCDDLEGLHNRLR